MDETPTFDGSVTTKVPRAAARLRVESLMYLSLGSDNGGFPINLSEEGMAFQGIRPLRKDQEICVTFKLDGVEEPVTATARIVWLTESGKAGALQFVDMPNASRQKIRQWIEMQKKAESPQHSADLEMSPVVSAARAPVKTPAAASNKPPAKAPQKPRNPVSAATAVANPPTAPLSSKAAPVSAETDAPSLPILASIPVPSAEPGSVATNSSGREAGAPDARANASAPTTPVLLMPEFAPAPSRPERDPAQAGRSSVAIVVPKAEIEPKKSAAIQAAPDSAGAHQAVWVAMPPRRKKKSGFPFSLAIGSAASAGIAAACVLLLWPYRSTLLQRFQANSATKMVSPAPVSAPAHTDETPVAEAPVNLPVKDTSQLAPLENALETQSAASAEPAVNVSTNAPAVQAAVASRMKSPAPIVSPANSRKAGAVHAPITSSLHPEPPAVVLSTRNRVLGVAAPAVSSAEGANDLPGAGAKVPLLETKAPASPITVTGSVEIIPDPYPSIRKTAGPQQGPSSKLGASLQLGRLTSKIDPVYPQEALRQKITGSVKVHVVIGTTGTVESAEMVNGPAQLAEPAVRAIEQWRYEPTLVGGTAVEVDENVTLVFRVASISPAN